MGDQLLYYSEWKPSLPRFSSYERISYCGHFSTLSASGSPVGAIAEVGNPSAVSPDAETVLQPRLLEQVHIRPLYEGLFRMAEVEIFNSFGYRFVIMQAWRRRTIFSRGKPS